MNIHQADKYNYSNFLRLFSKNKKDDFISNLKNSFSNVSGNYNSNTIEDVLKGTVKNSYGVEGMDITNKKALTGANILILYIFYISTINPFNIDKFLL